MKASADNGDGGFALVETIVAFVILATALAVAVETISQSVRTARRADDLERAVDMLERLRVGTLDAIHQPGILGDGASDGGWRAVAEPLPDDRARPLFAVAVTIWPRGEAGPDFTFRTFASGGTEP